MSGHQLKRRDFILVAGVTALWTAFAAYAHAQHPKPSHIAWIAMGPIPHIGRFREGMNALGHVEGRSYVILERYAAGDAARLPSLVDELLRDKVDIFVVAGAVPVRTVAEATKAIPIVGVMGDPLHSGLIEMLARPGGNVTGFSIVSVDIAPKLLELAKEAVPNLTRAVVLADTASERSAATIEMLGPSLGVTVTRLRVEGVADIEMAFRRAAELSAEAIIVPSSAFFGSQARHIVDLSRQFRLPGMYEGRLFSQAGGLISYGPNVGDSFRRAAFHVDRILKGAKPADLPVEQASKFELIVNLKTAHALGITIPPSFLVRADEVIE